EFEGVLWHYISPDRTAPLRLRMYLWHENKGKNSAPAPVEGTLTTPAYVAVTLRNPKPGVTLQVTGARRQVSTWTTNPLAAGICLAKATLGETLDSFTVGNVAALTTSILQKHALAVDAGVGAVYDFTVGP